RGRTRSIKSPGQSRANSRAASPVPPEDGNATSAGAAGADYLLGLLDEAAAKVGALSGGEGAGGESPVMTASVPVHGVGTDGAVPAFKRSPSQSSRKSRVRASPPPPPRTKLRTVSNPPQPGASVLETGVAPATVAGHDTMGTPPPKPPPSGPLPAQPAESAKPLTLVTLNDAGLSKDETTAGVPITSPSSPGADSAMEVTIEPIESGLDTAADDLVSDTPTPSEPPSAHLPITTALDPPTEPTTETTEFEQTTVIQKTTTTTIATTEGILPAVPTTQRESQSLESLTSIFFPAPPTTIPIMEREE
ncbi:hypothetical protein HK102_010938, partial [Quaeritorhiza haematococci]